MEIVEMLMWVFSFLLATVVVVSAKALVDEKADGKAIGWHRQRWSDED